MCDPKNVGPVFYPSSTFYLGWTNFPSVKYRLRAVMFFVISVVKLLYLCFHLNKNVRDLILTI